jgi:aldehyde dehydrogenase (NAD+)
VARRLARLLDEAQAAGAIVMGDGSAGKPVLLAGVTPEMSVAQADIFAPVLMAIEVDGEAGVLAAQAACPFGLACSIFGNERDARRLAAKLTVGTVTINDAIACTADPCMPFGGRRQSGYGVTRGAEGLLEMTAVKTILARRGRSARHYEATGARHEGLFGGLILAAHAGTLRERVRGLLELFAAGRRLKRK